MPDRNDLPGSWLATLVALTAVGIGTSHAQPPLPAAITPTGADLFKQQCATCHSLNAADPPRQGPVLAGVYGRKPGSLAGFRYSPGYGRHHALQTKELICSAGDREPPTHCFGVISAPSEKR